MGVLKSIFLESIWIHFELKLRGLGFGRNSRDPARGARERRIARNGAIGVPTGMAPNPNAAPVLFDRALLRARQSRALGLGSTAFLLDRVAEDMAERLHAVLREFK